MTTGDADARPVAAWRVVAKSGREVCQLPARLAPTAAKAEEVLRRNLGDAWQADWCIVPLLRRTAP